MGHEIVYCSGCQTQLRTPDFDKGSAYRIEGRSYCEKCARELIATLPEDRANDILRAFESTHDEAPAAGPIPKAAPASTRRMAVVQPQNKNATAVIVGGAVLLIAVVALVVVAGSGSAPSSKPPAAERVAPPVALPPPPPPAEVRVGKKIAAAYEYGRQHPDKLEKRIALFEEAALEPGASRYSAELDAALRDLRRKLSDARAAALVPVEAEMRAAIGRQDFKAAAAAVAGARSRLADPEWNRSLERLGQEVESELVRTFGTLRTTAVDARRRGAAEEVRQIQARVAGWDRPDLSRDLDTALAGSEPPPPAPAPAPAPVPSAAETDAARKEAAAQDLFASAETLHRHPSTRGEAVAKYCLLLSDYSSTPLVASKRAVVTERLESTKDQIFIAGDLRPTGAFRSTAQKKAAAVWTAEADVPAAARPQNHVELSFAAIPGVEYAAWVYAGACCAEAFVLHVQGSELASVDPKTREKFVAEPGSGLFVTLKPATSLLKSHAGHGARRDPVLWQWVPLALPKYAAAGEKRLRFTGEVQGFSVAWAAVSATRKAPPSEAEMREAEKKRPEAAPPPEEKGLRAGLVAHWRMDEGTGLAVADATGNGHRGTLKNGVSWTAGVIGKALKFDGDAGQVDCGTSDALNVRKAVTLSAWVKCTVDPILWDGVAMKSDFGWVSGYGFWFQSAAEIRFFVGHHGSDFASSSISPREWNHLAGTYDGKRIRIYVNGKEGTGKDRAGEIPPCSQSFYIGRASQATPTEHTLNGEIDDVRLYDRALDESEIRALHALRR